MLKKGIKDHIFIHLDFKKNERNVKTDNYWFALENLAKFVRNELITYNEYNNKIVSFIKEFFSKLPREFRLIKFIECEVRHFSNQLANFYNVPIDNLYEPQTIVQLTIDYSNLSTGYPKMTLTSDTPNKNGERILVVLVKYPNDFYDFVFNFLPHIPKNLIINLEKC